jgi:hypothetical protein
VARNSGRGAARDTDRPRSVDSGRARCRGRCRSGMVGADGYDGRDKRTRRFGYGLHPPAWGTVVAVAGARGSLRGAKAAGSFPPGALLRLVQ